MNAQEEEIYRQRRVRLAERVKSEAELHKVCLVCTSVSCKTIAICPVCHSYQWDESAAAVTEAVDRAWRHEECQFARCPFPGMASP